MRLLSLLLFFAATAIAQDAPAKQEESRERDVIYGRKSGLALTMDVFKPQKPNGAAVLYVISSGWFSSPRAMRINRFGILTERGYTVFGVIHGSTPRFSVLDIAPDIHRAVRFVRYHHRRFGIDRDRIAIMGTSAGGHLSMLVATAGDKGDEDATDPVLRESSRVQAAAAFFPPTDFVNWGRPGMLVTETILKDRFRGPFDFKRYDRITNSYEPVKDRKPLLIELSPVTHASKDDPPAILFHGTRDPVRAAAAEPGAVREAEGRRREDPACGQGGPGPRLARHGRRREENR